MFEYTIVSLDSTYCLVALELVNLVVTRIHLGEMMESLVKQLGSRSITVCTNMIWRRVNVAVLTLK